MKLFQETRKIMGLPDLDVTMTCVRVPVPVGHSAATQQSRARICGSPARPAKRRSVSRIFAAG